MEEEMCQQYDTKMQSTELAHGRKDAPTLWCRNHKRQQGREKRCANNMVQELSVERNPCGKRMCQHYDTKKEMDNPRTDKDAPTLWYKTRYMLREGTTGEIAEGRGDRNLQRKGSQGTAWGSLVQNREMEDGGIFTF